MKLQDAQKDLARKMLANCVDNRTGLNELFSVNGIDMIFEANKDELEFEMDVFLALKSIRDNNLAPDRTALEDQLIHKYSQPGELQKFMDDLIAFQTQDKRVISIAVGFKDWLDRNKLILALMEGMKAAQDPFVPAVDAYGTAVGALKKVAPYSRRFRTITGVQAMREWREMQRENLRLHRSGQVIGPRLPWPKTWRHMPYLRPGELCTIEGKTKFGKSTYATLIAWHIAYEMGFDVLFVHLETNAMTFVSRQLARELWVPVDYLEQGFYYDSIGIEHEIDFDAAPWKDEYERIEQEVLLKEAYTGRIWYHHAAGATINDIDLEVSRRVAESERTGRKLVLMIDYLQKVHLDASDKPGNEPSILSNVTDRIKEITENYGIYTILMAQTDPNTRFESAPYPTTRWTNAPGEKSQAIIRIERAENAEDEVPLFVGPQSQAVQKINGVGEPVFYHRVGELDSFMNMNFVSGNSIQRGKVKLRIVNKYFRVNEE